MAHPTLATLLADQKEFFCATLAETVRRTPNTIYSAMSDKQVADMAALVAENVIADFAGTQLIERFAERMMRQRVQDPNYTPQSVQVILDAIDAGLAALVDRNFTVPGAEREEAILAAKDLVMRDLATCYINYSMAREEALRESIQEQSQLLEMVRELSSPIIPVHDSILVLPLVGSVDTSRAQTIMEDLLVRIVDRQAEVVIIDITGVPLVDTSIANYLIQATRAVNLLGARTILVGIGPEVAQTLVGLDLDLGQLTVRANLQDGIAYALAALGFAIMPIGAPERPRLSRNRSY